MWRHGESVDTELAPVDAADKIPALQGSGDVTRSGHCVEDLLRMRIAELAAAH
jgi:hypothetical protein